ncbi:MAG: glutamine-hydrolyzing carbamoyl-phosphate synthase small subunit [Candidatus Micrarchaeota archaeon]
MKEFAAAKLVLSDGSVFRGFSFGAPRSVAGEVVFNTGMTGYPQSLTDPSYAGQILCFTYPLIGNYGVGKTTKDAFGLHSNYESNRVQAEGLVVSEYSAAHSHWDARCSLGEWLKENRVPAIFGVDTRALTIKLREKGVMLGKIIVDGDEARFEKKEFYDPNKENLVARVSRKRVERYGHGNFRVAVVDCGMKNNILRCLLARGVRASVVPWNYDFNRLDCDGVFVSNGPGDPTQCVETIRRLKEAMKIGTPVFGICLGNQLLALAAGARTFKLKYGHRSQNQPCVNAAGVYGERGRGFITSQNHGYAVDSRSLPAGWRELFFNANDGTNEGVAHASKPFFSVQFHPEGSCGPRDSEFLFDEFVLAMKKKEKGGK